MQLAKAVTQLINDLPNSERYTYRDQIIRCSISIPSNIAEGCSRNSRKDFKRFLRISLGSSFELETQLLLLQENSIIEAVILKPVLDLNTETQKMLHTLLKK
jgi:four helix bundle protein